MNVPLVPLSLCCRVIFLKQKHFHTPRPPPRLLGIDKMWGSIEALGFPQLFWITLITCDISNEKCCKLDSIFSLISRRILTKSNLWPNFLIGSWFSKFSEELPYPNLEMVVKGFLGLNITRSVHNTTNKGKGHW